MFKLVTHVHINAQISFYFLFLWIKTIQYCDYLEKGFVYKTREHLRCFDDTLKDVRRFTFNIINDFALKFHVKQNYVHFPHLVWSWCFCISRWETGSNLSRSPVLHAAPWRQSFTFAPRVNFESPVYLTCRFVDCGSKIKYPGITHT